MGKRTVKAVFFNSRSAGLVRRGESADFSKEDIERGERLGAFSDETESDSLRTAFTTSGPGDPGGEHHSAENGGAGDGNGSGVDAIVPSELTDEQIDNLTGQQLDDAVEAAGIDASTGGSRQDGSLSAEEKRAALKAANAS
jgi:hypothetical protein